MEHNAILIEGSRNMEVAINDGHRAKTQMPTGGELGSAPGRESRDARQNGVRLLQWIVVNEN